ncbi:MAG: helix-turn-helix domain-containing protein, partial [Actinobacteria bacterium]|nr:helix-turn-helix domain-containing protein [Actinomycetota bacterium]
MTEQLLTATQVATLLNLNVKTVYTLIHKEGLPAAKIGSQWRFPKTRILAWLDARHRDPTSND